MEENENLDEVVITVDGDEVDVGDNEVLDSSDGLDSGYVISLSDDFPDLNVYLESIDKYNVIQTYILVIIALFVFFKG